MEYAVRSLVMLSTVVAINFNITHIRFCIQVRTRLTPCMRVRPRTLVSRPAALVTQPWVWSGVFEPRGGRFVPQNAFPRP